MTWLPVGMLALQEEGPYSARDEDEMIALIDLMHSDWHLYADRKGLRRVCFVPTGTHPSRREQENGHLLLDQPSFSRQQEGPPLSGEWQTDIPLYTEDWYTARDELFKREAEDGTNERTDAMIAEFGRWKVYEDNHSWFPRLRAPKARRR